MALSAAVTDCPTRGAAAGRHMAGPRGIRTDELVTVDPRAHLLDEGGTEPFEPDLTGAACADRTGLEWVPETEDDLVPQGQVEVCVSCEARTDCLIWATLTGSVGYWGGTTTQDRQELWRAGRVDVAAADQLRGQQLQGREHERRQDQARALHPPGDGDLWWYRRRGCRCAECRSQHAANRARERARRRVAA